MANQQDEPSAATSNTKVFISYSRSDAAFSQKLLAGLQAAGFQPFMDTEEIAGGEEWEARLLALIRAADTVIYVISPRSIASRHCEWEIRSAQDLGKRIIPLVWERVVDEATPPNLKRLNYVFFDQKAAFEPQLSYLTNLLNTNIDWVREHTRLTDIAIRWDSIGRPSAMLLYGAEQQNVKRWLKKSPPDSQRPIGLLAAFLTESDIQEGKRATFEREHSTFKNITTQQARSINRLRSFSQRAFISVCAFYVGVCLFLARFFIAHGDFDILLYPFVGAVLIYFLLPAIDYGKASGAPFLVPICAVLIVCTGLGLIALPSLRSIALEDILHSAPQIFNQPIIYYVGVVSILALLHVAFFYLSFVADVDGVDMEY